MRVGACWRVRDTYDVISDVLFTRNPVSWLVGSEALNLSSWKKMGFFCLSLSPALQFSSALSPSQGHHDAHYQREGHTLSDAASHFLVHSTERTFEISIAP